MATDWSDVEIAPLAAALRPARVAWVRPTGGDDPTGLVARGFPADAALGGPSWGYRRLEAEGRLAAVPGLGRAWVVARREPLGLAMPAAAVEAGGGVEPPRTWSDLAQPAWAGRVVLADPRTDAVSLATAGAWLDGGAWRDRYADLVRVAGQARTTGRAGPAPAAGAAVVTPTAAHRVAGRDGVTFRPWPELGEWTEGAAVLAGARAPELAARLVRAASSRAGDGPPPEAADPGPRALLADLLGATLVEAEPELRAAVAALRASSRPEADHAAAWMVQPPPWPPASIATLRADPDGEALADALNAQLAPDPPGRAWLLVSWERPEAPIDGAFLTELAGAAGGRLAREPRLREWLRGEWAAWARQRYRRVARLAAGKVAPS